MVVGGGESVWRASEGDEVRREGADGGTTRAAMALPCRPRRRTERSAFLRGAALKIRGPLRATRAVDGWGDWSGIAVMRPRVREGGDGRPAWGSGTCPSRRGARLRRRAARLQRDACDLTRRNSGLSRNYGPRD